jgi:hypothetical protein
MFLFTLGGKYIKLRTCQEKYNAVYITVMNKFHSLVSQRSKHLLHLADSMFTRETLRINTIYYYI